ncbi:uncharacterized protein LOC106641617 [Copidosoma floridanum]|uniref:uncharacterized protein LOC106641617 n=1 Tax=Copidosoma floridanum TaxID=29053 RepID=UPI0006C9E5F9|nr:uncharacterized protein LOC106641617 [Copidosoma floridanum]
MDSNEYKIEVQSILSYALNNNIPPEQADKIFQECFCLLDIKVHSRIITALKWLKFVGTLFCVIFLSTFILYNHPQTHSLLLRNLQGYIYPGFRIFRKLAVPVISTYPSLTEWYDEWCIVENPFFKVNEMDCWPCSNVDSVKNYSGYKVTFNFGTPFTRLERYTNFDIDELFKLYVQNEKYFRNTRCLVNNETFDKNAIVKEKKHITWRINRMEIDRKLRKLLPKLPGVPDWWNPSTEKFVFFDKPDAIKYSLPNPECANVIIQCISGERLIQLLPSPECTRNCHKLHVLLSASQSLWYNWWYWRPVSLPSSNSTNTTITYLTSFC